MSELQFDESKLLKPNLLYYLSKGELSYFGLSLTGENHLKSGTVCQDANYINMINNNHPTVIAAIADGVGSCSLSHYGSSIAVKTATDYLTSIFSQLDISKTEDKIIGEYIRMAMQKALDAVEEEATKNQRLLYSYQSTLTIAIYDGKNLYFGHVGDDGIVALTSAGNLVMITSRMKGETDTSVFPLQSKKENWQVGKCTEPVDGFMMATDGVLDAVVRRKENNRIYYPFMEQGFKGTDLLQTGKLYGSSMKSQNFRQQVTDDITVVFVRNQKIKNNPYRFNVDKWNAESKYYEEQQQKVVYSENNKRYK